MKVKLVVVGGTTKNQEVRPRLPAVIGRGRECSVQLPHPLVSRAHCELFEESGRLYVRDLSALNGTFVDGQKITCAPLIAGSMLIVGPITFRVEVEAAEVVPAPADLLPNPAPRPTAPAPIATAPIATAPIATAPIATALPASAMSPAGLPRGPIPMALPLPVTALPASALPASALPASALPASALPVHPLAPAQPAPAAAVPPQPAPAPTPEPAPINGTTTEAELADFLRSLRNKP
jgi:predicted component of type VI protein secretion system